MSEKNLHNSIGERLRILRETAGLSQQQLADLRHTTQSTVAKQENGTRAVGEEGIIWYANYFGVTADYLLGRTEGEHGYISYVTHLGGKDGLIKTKRKGPLTESEREEMSAAMKRMEDEELTEGVTQLVNRIVDERIEGIIRRLKPDRVDVD